MPSRLVLMLLLGGMLFGVAGGAETDVLQVWTVDPLVKVFRDAVPMEVGYTEAEVARGEHASFQVVVRSTKDLSGLTASLGALNLESGEAVLDVKAPRFVGYVPVDRPTQKPSEDQLRKTPADYPDPLLEMDSVDLKAGVAQPVWLTVPVSVDAAPGVYRGEVQLSGEEVSAVQKIAVRVYAATIEDTTLWVTDWFGVNARHMEIAPEAESEAYYALLRRFARNMAEHRHTVAIISPLSLAEFSVGEGGMLQADFTRFDRWVRIFQEEGVVGLIEGGHIGGRKGGWLSSFVVTVKSVKDGEVVSKRVEPDSEAAKEFYAYWFPELVAHLREKDWLKCYVQHLADEPIGTNVKSYKAMAALARTYAPELKIIEACHTKELTGSMDIWVPQLNYLHVDFAHYQERQAAGDEVWFYTCVFPQGEYANRFIELPLIKTRLLHWINFKYGVTGYLHWGYNHWTPDSPFTHTTRPHGGPPYLPAGDPWIVYPGKDGPLDSIRFEAMRDGIADYELLSMLDKRNAKMAQALARRFILDFDRYNTDVAEFRKARREMLEALSAD